MKHIETEIRIGNFKRNKPFDTNLKKDVFSYYKNYFDNNGMFESSPLMKITLKRRDGMRYYEIEGGYTSNKKTNIEITDEPSAGIRVAISSEEEFKSSESEFDGVNRDTIKRIRYQYKSKSDYKGGPEGGFKVDLTIDTGSGTIRRSVEFELNTNKIPESNEINRLRHVVLRVKHEIDHKILILKSMNGLLRCVKNYRGSGPGYMSKPISLDRKDIPFLKNYMFLPKLDGVHYLTYFNDRHMYMSNQTDFKYIGEHDGRLKNSVLIGEYMKCNNTMYVFDSPMFKGRNITNYSYVDRLRAFSHPDREYMSTLNIQFNKIYDTPVKAVSYNDLKTDGVICCARNGLYINGNTYKWKPAEDQTIDFLYKKGMLYNYIRDSDSEKVINGFNINNVQGVDTIITEIINNDSRPLNTIIGINQPISNDKNYIMVLVDKYMDGESDDVTSIQLKDTDTKQLIQNIKNVAIKYFIVETDDGGVTFKQISPDSQNKLNMKNLFDGFNLLYIKPNITICSRKSDTDNIFTHHKNIKHNGTHYAPFNTEGSVIKQITGGEGKVVEYLWDIKKKVFTPTRIRHDKIKPNFYTVANNIAESLKDPITEEEFTIVNKRTLKILLQILGDKKELFHNIRGDYDLMIRSYIKKKFPVKKGNSLFAYINNVIIEDNNLCGRKSKPGSIYYWSTLTHGIVPDTFKIESESGYSPALSNFFPTGNEIGTDGIEMYIESEGQVFNTVEIAYQFAKAAFYDGFFNQHSPCIMDALQRQFTMDTTSSEAKKNGKPENIINVVVGVFKDVVDAKSEIEVDFKHYNGEWKKRNRDVMKQLLIQKFNQDPLRMLLISTGDHFLYKTKSGDGESIWEISEKGGRKHAGADVSKWGMFGDILMEIRTDLKNKMVHDVEGSDYIISSPTYTPSEYMDNCVDGCSGLQGGF